MSNIGLSTDLVLANTSVRPGTLVLPLSTQIPGRTITIKCATGSCAVSTCYISTSGGDTFEDGSTTQALTTNYGFIKVTSRAGKWYTGATTQPNMFTASTINAATTQATAISTGNMTVRSLSLGSTNALYTSSSLAYWGPYLLNSGFRSAQPQVFFPQASLLSTALTYLPLTTNSTDQGTLPQTVTTVGTVSYTTVGGKQTAYFTNNPNNYFRLPYVNQTTFTLCYWMYPADSGYYTSISIAGLDLTNGTNTNPVLQTDIQNSSITIYTAMPSYWTNQPTGTTNGVGAWTHIAITINQTTYVEQLYINGALAATATGSGSSISGRGYFYLGRSGDWGPRAANGYVRQFAFFGRVLSASEVSQIYNGTG